MWATGAFLVSGGPYKTARLGWKKEPLSASSRKGVAYGIPPPGMHSGSCYGGVHDKVFMKPLRLRGGMAQDMIITDVRDLFKEK